MRAHRSARRSARGSARTVRPAPALAGLLLAAALALTGCSAGDSDEGRAGTAATGAARPDAREAAPGAAGGDGDRSTASGTRATAPPRLTAQHIIRTASLTVRVKDVPKALETARTAVENAGGYVGDETTTRDEAGRVRTRVVLRVPTDRYDEVLADLEGTGTLLDRTAKAQDVTDRVVDVESRIKSQRASVARVRALMERATRLSDVVALEGELSRREADLEALLAQQASLKDRTGMATITLSLSEAPAPKAGNDDDQPGFTDALAGGWQTFVGVLRWISLAVGAVLPFAGAAALLAVVWRWIVRPRLPRRPAAPASPAAAAPAPASPAAAAPAPASPAPAAPAPASPAPAGPASAGPDPAGEPDEHA
ncbi:DUF4349 domain-containing protein [Streptomyces sp. LB8]|uniref:DUF4349 domain-containing protein n=1 Tax=Streptomyces sp. LB8 TaxID=3042509 RepID=UPI0026487D7A|nr:DUF4349 domain-containing protein [Streptomyces sp. LB8]MDN5382636.1 DUF4349 domain-containing protein [Streptomyces sp. LB8]